MSDLELIETAIKAKLGFPNELALCFLLNMLAERIGELSNE